MATIYAIPDRDEDVVQMLRHVMDKWHQPLAQLQVRVGILLATNPEGGGAVKHGGYPAMATIKPTSLKDRVSKGYDAELVIDGEIWDQLAEETKAALIDHELSHITPVVKKGVDGKLAPQLDDLGRPKLKSVKGDWNCGDGFKHVVSRHGADAVEFENIRRAHAIAVAAANEGGR